MTDEQVDFRMSLWRQMFEACGVRLDERAPAWPAIRWFFESLLVEECEHANGCYAAGLQDGAAAMARLQGADLRRAFREGARFVCVQHNLPLPAILDDSAGRTSSDVLH